MLTTDFVAEVASATDLHPGICGLLKSLPFGSYAQLHYSLRHPGAIFNISFYSTLFALNALLDELAKSPIDRDLVALRHTGLLLALSNYSEAFHEMLLALSRPEARPPENRPLWQVLRDRGYKAVQNYHELLKKTDCMYFRDVFNELKHSSTVLRTLVVDTPFGTVVGYYLESAFRDGSVGPAERFHPKWHGCLTANSFNKDIRRIYHLVYQLSHVMGNCLSAHMQDVHGLTLVAGRPYSDAKDTLTLRVYERTSRLSNLCFADEVGQTLPEPLLENTEPPALRFRFRKVPMLHREAKVQLSIKGDGYTRSWKVPYWLGPSSH
jgi:hypothetical protein